jgi:hypothetical protein
MASDIAIWSSAVAPERQVNAFFQAAGTLEARREPAKRISAGMAVNAL